MSKKQERESAAAFAAANQRQSDSTPQLAGYRRSLVKLSGYFLLGVALATIAMVLLASLPNKHSTKTPMLKVPASTEQPVEGGGGYLDPLPDKRPRGVAPPQRSNKVTPLPPAKPLHPIQPRRDA